MPFSTAHRILFTERRWLSSRFNQLLVFFLLHRLAILVGRNQLIRIAQVLIAEDDDVREPFYGVL